MNDFVEICDYTPSDGRVCHGLRRGAFLEVFRASLSLEAVQAGADSYGVAEFTERIGAMRTLVAKVDGAVVGFCTMKVDSEDRAELVYLYIDPAHRGAHLGSRLVRRSERQVLLSHPGVTILYLDTAVPDYNQAFWERMGYHYVGTSACDYPRGRIAAARLEKNVGDCCAEST